MNFDRAVSLVVSACGNIPSLKPKVEDMMEYVKEFQLERDAALVPWFLYEKRTLVVPATEVEFNMPLGFIKERDKAFLRVVGEKKYWYKIMAGQEDAVSATEIGAYFYEMSVVGLTLESDEDRTFELHGYWQTPTLKESQTTNPWLLYAGDWLVSATASAMLADMQDAEASMKQELNVIRARNRIQGETIERMHGGYV